MKSVGSNKDLLDLLGFFDPGDWFVMPEDEVIVSDGEIRDGKPFAVTKAGYGWGGRRVISINRPDGPSTVVRARTSADDANHSAHVDCGDSCAIDRDGRICWDVPCTVKSSLFSLNHWSCTENEQRIIEMIENI